MTLSGMSGEKGLMLAAELNIEAADIINQCIEAGIAHHFRRQQNSALCAAADYY